MEPCQFDLFGPGASGRDMPPAPDGAEETSEPTLPLSGMETAASEAAPPQAPESSPAWPAARSEIPEEPEQLPVTPVPGPGEVGPSSMPAFARVRILNAVTDGMPLRVILCSRLLTPCLKPCHLTGYFTVSAGFRTLTLFDAAFPWTILFRSSLPFVPGETATLAVVRAGAGLDLVRIDDRPCGNRGMNRACIRSVNLVHNSPGLDLVLTDGRLVFTDTRFKETTTYRRARPGQYDMYVAQTPWGQPDDLSDIETVEEMPVTISSCYFPGYGAAEPLASFFLPARAGAMETIYLMGRWGQPIRASIVENF